MARTSRNGAPAASVDALDNLNLDDMFADEGDALFADLDIDLGNMDDIAESSVVTNSTAADLKTSAGPLHQSFLPPAAADLQDDPSSMGGAGKRRTTKRKIKSPMFFADEDDDYVDEPVSKTKKKKKASSATTTTPTKSSQVSTKAGAASKKKGASKNVAAATTTSSATGTATASVAAVVPAGASASDSRKSKPAKGKKAQRSVSMPPPAGRVGSATVAAAGQFGGRQKRAGASFSVPGSGGQNRSKGTAPQPGVARGASASTAATSTTSSLSSPTGSDPSKLPGARSQPSTNHTLAQIAATHPGLTQSPFCGLLPSNTLFYPFMPALPAEPSFKHRKIFPMIDRIHTALTSHLTSSSSAAAAAAASTSPGKVPVQEAEAIFQLMQDAFRGDEKAAGGNAASSSGGHGVDPPSASTTVSAERLQSIGNAIGTLRKSIGSLERNRLVVDLLAVCALLKRQYDFLKQNLSNMEQWCKGHFPEAEYAAVYLEPKLDGMASEDGGAVSVPAAKVTSVLSTFGKAEVKVKVLCPNFKDPKAGTLLAVLPAAVLVPPSTFALAGDAGAAKPTAKSKKRKLAPAAAVSSPMGSKLSLAKPADVVLPKPVATYAQMRPSKRRKCVSELIARSARELESNYLLRFDDQRQLMNRQQGEMLQLVQEDPILGLHTLGMWKWLDKAGYFGRITDGDIRWRLDGNVTPNVRPSNTTQSSVSLAASQGVSIDSDVMIGQIQSLLVDEGVEEDGDAIVSDCESDEDAELFVDETPSRDRTALDHPQGSAPTKLSSSLDLLGLGADVVGSLPHPSKASNGGMTAEATESGDELGAIIRAMIMDLQQLNNFNRKRTTFLESVAQSYHSGESAGKRAEDASLIARCQQLIRKTKESKGKNGKLKTAKKDEYALPW